MNIKCSGFFEKAKKGITLSILALFMLMFIFYQFGVIRAREFASFDSTIVAYKFLIVAIVSMACVFLSYIWIVKKQADICKVYLFSIIALGTAYMVIFLPHTVPDEPVHYFNAYGLSNYFTFNFEQANVEKLLMRQSDIDFFSNASTSQSADYYYTIKNSLSLFSKNNALVEYTGHSANSVANSSFGYVFSAMGIAFARLFRLSPVLTYYFGRFFNMLSYAFMSWWAIKKIPYGKMAIFTISALPMSLHLTASYSYDSQITALAMLFVAQVLYMAEKETAINYKDIILCGIFGMLLAPSKLVYLPIVLLVFIIPKEKFSFSPKKVFWIKVAIVAAAVVFMLSMQLRVLVSTVSKETISWAGEEARSVSWILSNPIETIKIYVNTLFDLGEFYLNTLVGSSLGWFQINVPTYCFVPFFGFLVYSFMARNGESSKISFGNKLWLLLLVMGSAVLIFTSMFLGWTPMSYKIIEGVQGRYFIPLLIVVYLLLRNKFITVSPKADKYAMFMLLYWSLFVGIQYFVTSFV